MAHHGFDYKCFQIAAMHNNVPLNKTQWKNYITGKIDNISKLYTQNLIKTTLQWKTYFAKERFSFFFLQNCKAIKHQKYISTFTNGL